MAKISLRDYLSGIEELIDKDRTEDALAHCRHIITLFPKNVAAYRMMGKAYLESHQHAEARDIFQRVLSSCPDDFVSHIGMSIIREDTNDMDGAVWNMERAFEAQPSNRAVQDELRRLYGKREGYAPPKVRLTRGALARMYAHGDLFNQAIGELRSALTEDPQRPDLQLLLAEMYYKTKRETDAIEVCSALIQKLPYCLYANRLMVDIMREGQREVEAKPYLERVEEMDPYAAHVDTKTLVDSVPADLVMLEQLVIETAEAKAQPIPKAWTGSLEMADENFEKENLPEWLSLDAIGEQAEKVEEKPTKKPSAMLESLESLEPIPTGDLGKPSTTAPISALSDDQIPEWLRELRPSTTSLADASAQMATRESAQAESAQGSGEDEPVEQKLSTGQIAALFSEDEKPQSEEVQVEPQTSETKSLTPSAEDEDDLGWLEKLAAQQDTSAEELPTKPEEREAAAPSLPPAEKPEGSGDSLAWLDDMAAEAEPPSSSSPPTEAPTPFASDEETPTIGTTPSWLKELSAESNEAEPIEPAAEDIAPRPLEEAPDWLKELRPGTDEISAVDEGVEAEPSQQAAEEIPPRPLDEAPDWLKDVRPNTDEIPAVEAGVAAETIDQPVEEIAPRPLEEAPDWLKELRPGTDEIPEIDEAVVEPVEAEVAQSDLQEEELSKLEWLDELGPAKVPQTKSEWVPEAQTSGNGEGNSIAAPQPIPPMSARRTATLKAEQEAPSRLEQARQALNFGKLDEAADQYGYLLRRRLLIQDVIADLDAAVHRIPSDATLWQILGDAYMRNNQLREALDCYTRAEDLL